MRPAIARRLPRVVKNLLVRQGLLPYARGGGTAVLCYHSISRRLGYQFAVSPEAFDAQLTYVKRFFERSPSLSKNSVAVTFDDGLRDNLETALPILERHGVPATFFISSSLPGQGYESYLNWSQIQKLAAHELITIGSHGRTHAPLTSLASADAEREIKGSKEEIEERLDRRIDLFAYPFGMHDPAIAGLAASAGYRAAFLAGPRLGSPADSFHIPRLVIDGSHEDIREFQFALADSFTNPIKS